MIKNKYHVVLIVPHFRTPEQLGGLRSWHIVNVLLVAGYRITVCAPGVDSMTGKKREGTGNIFFSKENRGELTLVWVGSSKNDRKSKLKRIIYYLTLGINQLLAIGAIDKPDVVISATLPVTSMLTGFVLSKRYNVPLLLEMRDFGFSAASEVGYIAECNILFNITKRIEWFFYRKSNYIVTVSRGFQRILVENGIDYKNTDVIPLGFDGKEVYEGFTDWKRNIRKEIGLEEKFIVLYSGNLGEVFDVERIIDAAALTKNHQSIWYVFLGGGQNQKEFQKKAEIASVNAIFVGARPKHEVPLFCREADICVYPAKKGKVVNAMLGNKIFDYMGNGCFVLYSGPSGDVSDLIREMGGGRCIGGDANEMAQEIIKLSRTIDKNQEMGRISQERVKESLTASITCREFPRVVQEILERNAMC